MDKNILGEEGMHVAYGFEDHSFLCDLHSLKRMVKICPWHFTFVCISLTINHLAFRIKAEYLCKKVRY